MSDIYEGSFPLENSMCQDCRNRFSRSMIPLDYESFGIDIDEFELEEGEPLILEQHICLISQDDLEGVVTECTHYRKRNSEFLKQILIDDYT